MFNDAVIGDRLHQYQRKPADDGGPCYRQHDSPKNTT